MSQTHLPYELWCGLVLLLLGPTMSQATEEPAYEVVHKLGESVDQALHGLCEVAGPTNATAMRRTLGL